MERDGEGTVRDRSISSTRVRTGSDPFLVACRLFSFVTALAAILCIAVNVYSAVRSFKHEYDVFDGIFRCYAVVIAIIVVVAETEWLFFTKFWKVLEFSAGRGMLQILIWAKENDLILLQNIASYFLITCGAINIISGLFCFGFIKCAHQAKEVSREQAIQDLQELERRREELEALLIQERA
ncbi:hypothetical protein K7X08_009000 [Anisodus acutangulus]|uniref:Golgi apparatus membrane protein TVP15 n=1 Tax=Anisodus acutangulus TaxID=402998 RepID=A0A9Q1MYN4_9SOLA|nr:hypothetical protein K7X08_009000 [Anisodus acutangulus]